MKLNVDFSKLERSLVMMEAESCDFEIEPAMPEAEFAFDQELIEGIQLKIDHVQTNTGLISTNGRQTLLYIPDHKNIEAALKDGSEGNKFHVAECKKIIEMREKDSGDRYIVTTGTSGKFKIYGERRSNKKEISGEVKLRVCKLCLRYLNYNGYANAPLEAKEEIVSKFDLKEFFSTYSSMFQHLPREQFAHRHRGYDDDFYERSKACRKRVNYTCQNCNVNLRTKKHLLDAHHPERIKSNSSIQDLIALCKDCHRKEPFHQHMPVSFHQMSTITRLRREQGLTNPTNWQSVRKFVDPALFGFIEMCQSLGLELPHVQYPVTNQQTNETIYLDIAWPSKRVALLSGKAVKVDKWYILEFKDAHNVLNKKERFSKFKSYMR
ncbi:HNH endonuclease [Endozoicomonas sp. SM1973]|uniref:HNH endonuclease n=1 Tax=Spartinivicinus marinus TaxID=2994442 RepID=A0A853IJG3_9GAMM|nr:HNH endonuclease [Spartinivicinus marinus]MCX4030330.1 HNH endonuclease [Spartinivicinus marinus]MCX4030510.1 HNH endonuclease [Spartinivicinus marinus]NYZ69537.1 HNH endonuclease [Spartinivicinus marinus]